MFILWTAEYIWRRDLKPGVIRVSMNIFSASENIHGDGRGRIMSERDLSKYVRRVMKLKGLTHKDVQRLSGGRITDAYVASISIGRAGNPSAEKLKALADGLGVDPDLLFHLACGMPDGLGGNRKVSPAAELMIILETVQKAVAVPDIVDILNELLRLSPKERATVLKSLRGVAAKPRSRRKNTTS